MKHVSRNEYRARAVEYKEYSDEYKAYDVDTYFNGIGTQKICVATEYGYDNVRLY